MVYRRIRDLREDADLLQKDIADYLSCTQVCYSHYENGKCDIPTDVLIKLATYYIDYLLGVPDRREPFLQHKGTSAADPAADVSPSSLPLQITNQAINLFSVVFDGFGR